MPFWLVFGALALYTAVLFWLAHVGDRRGHLLPRPARHLVYALALVVYCTSWTFFGAVGTATLSGWEYLPIYLGPLLAFSLGLPVMRRLIRVGHEQNTTSIAGFLAARYGKSQGLATLVTAIATAGALPYIALQLKAVSTSLAALTAATPGIPSAPNDGYVLIVALTLAAFAVLFGTRHVDVTRPNRGMMVALAAQSIFKLAVLILVAGFAALVLAGNGDLTIAQHVPSLSAFGDPGKLIDDRFIVLTLLSAAAMFCLPRQFHVTVVECEDRSALGPAAVVMIVVMVIVSMAVPPIATLGAVLVAGGDMPAGVDPDLLVLALPMFEQQPLLGLLAFLGGFAAATSMVIVATVALSLMISHDLISPMLIRMQLSGRGNSPVASFSRSDARSERREPYSVRLLVIRQVVILGLMMLSYQHYLGMDKSSALSGIGITSFAAIVQLLPALIGGLYWPRGHRVGAWMGLVGGMLVWFWWFGPFGAGTLGSDSPLGVWLAPSGIDPLTVGVVGSLVVNLLGYVAGSLLVRPSALDVQQARAFIGRPSRGDGEPLPGSPERHPYLTTGRVRLLLERVLGEEQTAAAIRNYAATNRPIPGDDEPATVDFIAHHEHRLARVIGASAARLLMGTAGSHERLATDDVLTLIDETSQKIQVSQRALQESERSIRFYLDNVPALIIFVDPDQRVRFANRAYCELFESDGKPVVGQTARDYLSASEYAERLPYIREVLAGRRVQFDITITVPAAATPGDFFSERRAASASVDEAIALRTIYYQVTYVPQFNEDGTLRGFFGLYQDVTARQEAERALRETNETLEERVRNRTAALSAVNEALRVAREEALRATRSKTRFLAAASHDLLQPLNAARLFTSALQASLPERDDQLHELTDSIDQSIRSADRLLRALLDISKLDSGGLKPDFTSFALNDLLREISTEFAARAADKGLVFRCMPCSLSIRSDRGLLLSVLQNLVSNAMRYTDRGRVVVGARRRGDSVSIQVLDTGRGIPADKSKEIFTEFHRLERDTRLHDSGVGLGLAITERIARLLEHPLSLTSQEGRGSCFSLQVPVASTRVAPRRRSRRSQDDLAAAASANVDRATIWCVDNESEVLAALEALLQRWGYAVRTAGGMDEVAGWMRDAGATPDVLLIDFQLDQGETGFDVLDLLQVHGRRPTGVALLTAASGSSDVQHLAADRNVTIIRKPVDPAALRAFISRSLRNRGDVAAT
jgi:Na+/proline symporter/signal transduction histidine kinase/CheY-like chemotaxis protein